jgi:hydrogenase expression/formation protein HypE
LATREELGFGGALTSDTASIYDLVQLLLNAGVAVRWMRDPTRGGVSAVLHELADAAQVSIEVEETALPIRSAVRGACEVLGMDPLYVANEGKLIAVVAAGDVERAIALLRNHPLGQEAAVIASVGPRGPSQVTLCNRFGQIRVLDEPSGALLPRIC